MERRVDGRFSFMEKPRAYPFADIVNNAPEGPVFDLGIDLEMRDGAVYIKAEHVQEMAEQLGMLSEVEADALRAENNSLKAMADTLPEKIAKFTNGINALVHDYHNDNLPDSVSSGGTSPEGTAEPEPETHSGTDKGTNKGIDKGELEALGQVSGFNFS